MATFEKCPKEVTQLARRVMAEQHVRLHNVDPIVGYLFAWPKKDKQGESKGPALTKGGYPVLYQVKVVSLKDRVAGLPDAVVSLKDRVAGLPDAMVVIDGDAWTERSEAGHIALLDEALSCLDASNEEDDAGRPKLRIRLPEIVVHAFGSILERHGKASPGAELLIEAVKQEPAKQLLQRTFAELWG